MSRSARSSRRPGSLPSSARRGMTTRGCCSTPGSTAAPPRATPGGASPPLALGRDDPVAVDCDRDGGQCRRGRPAAHLAGRGVVLTAVVVAVDDAVLDRGHQQLLVGAHRRVGLELALRRLGDHDLLVGEHDATTDRDLVGGRHLRARLHVVAAILVAAVATCAPGQRYGDTERTEALEDDPPVGPDPTDAAHARMAGLREPVPAPGPSAAEGGPPVTEPSAIEKRLP